MTSLISSLFFSHLSCSLISSMAAMATKTLTSSLSKTQFFDTKSSFHSSAVPICAAALKSGLSAATMSAGLSCVYELSKNPNIHVAIIEQSVSPVGGAWLGGQLFSAMVVRKPAHRFLDELDIAYDEQDEN